MSSFRIHVGNSQKILPTLPAESVDCVVTSPPYWGLRDYGEDAQLGLERTVQEYVSNLVELFREVRRVLKSEGTLWLNLGDCYATGAGSGRSMGGKHFGRQNPLIASGAYPKTQPNRLPQPGLKPKDLVGVPWRVAFALQADGWWLRSDIIWDKPNAMPESVTDRPTKAHEYLFLLSKSESYFFDQDAVREPQAEERPRARHGKNAFRGQAELRPRGNLQGDSRRLNPLGRNKRTVWTVATRPFPEAHFATFPEELVRPCIRAGCPAGGTVLDPFTGSGTTGAVAVQEFRDFVGIELNPTYAAMAERRIRAVAPLLVSGGAA